MVRSLIALLPLVALPLLMSVAHATPVPPFVFLCGTIGDPDEAIELDLSTNTFMWDGETLVRRSDLANASYKPYANVDLTEPDDDVKDYSFKVKEDGQSQQHAETWIALTLRQESEGNLMALRIMSASVSPTGYLSYAVVTTYSSCH